MFYTFGVLKKNSSIEIIDGYQRGSGYLSLIEAKNAGNKIMKEDPLVVQINIYNEIQEIKGQQKGRMIAHKIIREGHAPSDHMQHLE